MKRIITKVVRGLERELTALKVEARWRGKAERTTIKRAALDTKLVVSLTSYAPRFAKLHLTLKCLLMQSVRADAVVLWLAKADRAALPPSILALQNHGLTIATASDTRSFKKLIPALSAYPEAVIVTADDDAYYWPTWLEELVVAIDPARREILCHRAHRIVLAAEGTPAPYRKWEFETLNTEASPFTFPTGLGGTLYRPGLLPPEVSDRETFERLCPTADDVWLFWMASRNGAAFRKIGRTQRLITWRGTQKVGLFAQNIYGESANDSQIAAMVAAYGFPPTRPAGDTAGMPAEVATCQATRQTDPLTP